VGGADERQRVGEELHRGQDPLPDQRGPLDGGALLGAERARLVQDRLGHAQLADVVQRRRVAQRGKSGLAHTKPAADGLAALDQRGGPAGGGGGARVERRPERLRGSVLGALESLAQDRRAQARGELMRRRAQHARVAVVEGSGVGGLNRERSPGAAVHDHRRVELGAHIRCHGRTRVVRLAPDVRGEHEAPLAHAAPDQAAVRGERVVGQVGPPEGARSRDHHEPAVLEQAQQRGRVGAHGGVHLLDGGLDHGLGSGLLGQARAQGVREADLARPALAQHRALARRARRDRGPQEQRGFDPALLERGRAAVRVQLEQPGQVLVGGRGGQHAGASEQLEQGALGAVGPDVVDPRHESARAGMQQALRRRVLLRRVDLVVQAEAQPLQALVAPVGRRDRVDRGAPGRREGDRPGRGVQGLGEGHGHRLDPLQRSLVAQLAGEAVGQLPDRVAHALLGRPPQHAALGPLAGVGGARARGEDLTAAAALGAVERGVGGAHQLGERLHAAPERGRAARDHDRAAVTLLQIGQRGSGQVACVVEGGALHHQAELVSRQSSDQVPGTGSGGGDQHLGHALQGAVPGVVAGVVVDRLQLVDVAEHHRQRHVAVGGAGHGPLQAFLEGAPVGQPGQRVLVGEP
jgi:hypothetical protein